jgi:protein FRG1
MVSRLAFKGDAPKKRKHKSSRLPSEDKRLKINEEEEGWTSAQSFADLNGPVVIAISEEVPVVACADIGGKIYTSSEVDLVDKQTKPTVHRIEPSSVQQVFVLSHLGFDETSQNQYAFKSVNDKYLSAGKDYMLDAKASSIGPNQTFTVTPIEGGGWSIKTSTERFLSIRPDDESSSGYSVFADSEESSFQETFTLRVQAKYRQVPKILTQEDARISSKELKERAGRDVSEGELKMLKDAHAQGRLNEALLDLRQKAKRDSRC